MSMKYSVASRRIISKILGMVAYLLFHDFLAVITMIENARRSAMHDDEVLNVVRTSEVE
jgi:hypothetical protein